MVYGDNRPFIVGLLVLNKDNFERFVVSLNLDPKDPGNPYQQGSYQGNP